MSRNTRKLSSTPNDWLLGRCSFLLSHLEWFTAKFKLRTWSSGSNWDQRNVSEHVEIMMWFAPLYTRCSFFTKISVTTADMAGIDSLFGPMLIGVCLNSMLYGLLILQTYTYYQTRKDYGRPFLDYLVLYLLFMETLNTAFDIALIYEPLILRYGTEEAVKFVPLMLIADPIVMAFISTPIQLFFARRIYIISGSMLIVAPILFFAFCSLTGAIAATICTAIIREFARLQELKGAIMTWLFSSAIADIIITTSLLVHLYRKKTGVKATDDMINKIMRFTLQTGLLTSIFASLDVILFIAIPDTAYNFALDFPLSKLYTNSLLSSLNARVEYEKMKVDHLSVGNTTGAEGLEFRQFSSPQTHVPPGTFQRLRRGGATDLQQIPGETQQDPASPGGRSDFKVDLGLDGGSTPA